MHLGRGHQAHQYHKGNTLLSTTEAEKDQGCVTSESWIHANHSRQAKGRRAGYFMFFQANLYKMKDNIDSLVHTQTHLLSHSSACLKPTRSARCLTLYTRMLEWSRAREKSGIWWITQKQMNPQAHSHQDQIHQCNSLMPHHHLTVNGWTSHQEHRHGGFQNVALGKLEQR